MIVNVWVSTGIQGSDREVDIEMADDATDEEIEAAAKDAMFEMIEWSYSRAESPAPSDGGER